MGFANRTLSSLGKIGILAGIAIAFVVSFAGTVYLSLRSSEVKVPDIVGKDRVAAESILNDKSLNTRVRATRPSDQKPDTVLSQLPRAGEVVKAGQTVAVDISRMPKEGESPQTSNGAINNQAKSDQQKQETETNTNATSKADQTDVETKRKRNKTNSNKNANSNGSNSANSVAGTNRSNTNRNANRNANGSNKSNLNNRSDNLNRLRNANSNLNRRPVAGGTTTSPNTNNNKPKP